jgi:pimeloyl-ACP methyl ester carboxylesterase
VADDLLTLPDGRRAQLWQGGAQHGTSVFFFHGCPDTRHAAFSGDAAARRLCLRLVAVNRPGYGRSDPAESGHLSVADDTLAVADLLGIDRFAVLGMSVGGPYALACAARHPARVRAAAVVAAPGQIVEMEPPWHRDDLSTEQQDFLARIAHGTVAASMAVIRPEFEQYVAQLDPQDPDDEALARRYVGGLHPLDAELLAGQSSPRPHVRR